MSVGVRRLIVLGEFKPFGLVTEALDGESSAAISDDYEYFLFDPDVTRERDDASSDDAVSKAAAIEHELFVRRNRIIWTSGSRVLKRFTLPSAVVKACWSCLGDKREVFLCVLQVGCLTIYNTSGEVESIPLPRTVTSIWPLPYGLLLQQEAEVNQSTYIPVSSSGPLLGARDIPRSRKEIGHSPLQNLNSPSAYDHTIRGDISYTSSHMILRDLLEEPGPVCLEEKGKFIVMKEFDEKTIWTSDQIPLVVSYNKVKMQHSVWTAEVINYNFEVSPSSPAGIVPVGVLPKQVSFRRIWQAKGAKKASSKIFLSTDDDAVPVLCFLLIEQKKLLSVRLQTVEINNEIVCDIKPDMSWSFPAIAAEPVAVTRPRVKLGPLPYMDTIVLSPESIILLYSGKQCLCRYALPSCLVRNLVSHDLGAAQSTLPVHDLKITGLSNAVGGRINATMNHSQTFRCALQRTPASLLTNDCVTAIAEGMPNNLYNRFLSLLWRDSDFDSSENEPSINSEWDGFCNIFMQICRRSSIRPQNLPNPVQNSSWEFLLNSKFHKAYARVNCGIRVSPLKSTDPRETTTCNSKADNSEESLERQTELLMESLDSLHAVYESLKMDNLRKQDLERLAVVLCNIAKFLDEKCFLDHYIRDFPSLSEMFGTLESPLYGRKPANLFRWLENCVQHGYRYANSSDLPALIYKNGSSVVSWARKVVSFYSLLCGSLPVGKALSSGVHCNIAAGSYNSNEELVILAMVGERFGLQQLDLLPSGVSLPLRHALDKCRESPPFDWPAAAYVLLGREDLALSFSTRSCVSKDSQNNMNLVSMSTPYMLHLHPVIIPSSFNDSIGLESSKFEEAESVDGPMTDGMEHIFNSSTQLRYGRDLRLNEVRRLLCSARPVAIQTSANPSISDTEQQQDQLWRIAQRTAALSFGRGAFTLSTIHTLLTEAFVVPKLVLAGRLPAQQNVVVNLDSNVRNIQELKTWPEFHNAVAAGLRLAPLQGKVSRTWIIYNKPEEPNVIHAGLLFALGLQGYLQVLTITDIFQYFAQEHETSTVGLMLGLAASYRGTLQPAISKALFVHIPARYSTSFAELEIPTLLQSAALVSVGILFEGSAHPQTMQFLLGEIGRRSGGDNVLEREGYAVSAGFSLGLVALGRGDDTVGFMESFVGRLLHYLGAKEVHNERSFLSLPSDENRGVVQIMDGTIANIDVTAPGAIIALALMYLKTESEAIHSKLSIPQTHYDLQYVRPDFIMLRVIARNLIMWNRIYPTNDWIHSQIPEIVKTGVKHLRDDIDDVDDVDLEAIVQAYINIVTGACISLGLRFAGSKDGNARELLYDYALYLLNEIKPVSATTGRIFPRGLSRYVDRGTLEICLHLIVLSLSVVMAGSGDLQILRLLRFLRSRNSADGHANYGIQMAVSLAFGFLFIGGGMRTFSTNNGSIAMLLITLYPRLPAGPNDNRCHLQAFRHLYVLATEGRWIQTIDVDTGLPVYAPLEVTIKETELYSETNFCEVTPCILPERAILRRIRVCGPRYWPQEIDLVPEEKPWWSFGDKNDPFKSGILYIKRKVGACSYVDDPIGCQSLLSRAMHKVFGLKTSGGSDSGSHHQSGLDSDSIDQLVSTFSPDPSLIAFAQLCCDTSWNNRSDSDFKEFCLQVLFECVSKDRPALLQVYLSLYTTIGSMAELHVSKNSVVCDSLQISSLKLALAYNEAVTGGRFTTSSGIIQSIFLASLRKRVEEILSCSDRLRSALTHYLVSGNWRMDKSLGAKDLTLLSWYLKWYNVPSPSVINTAVEKIKPKLKFSSSAVPLLRLLLPSTHVNAISEIDKAFFLSPVGR